MAYLDPTLIKAAIDSGSYSSGKINNGGTLYYCDSSSGVWDVTTDVVDQITRPVFNLIKSGTINGDFTITTTAGIYQLVSDGGYANLIDP